MKKINCILLIDDDMAGNAFHGIVIKKSDVCSHVQTATTAIKGLDYILKSTEQPEFFPKPDLIYLDINMPGMNGFEFLDEYNKIEDKLTSQPVIIMLSSSLNPDDKTKAFNYKEIADFQNKPLTIESVQETVRKYFHQKSRYDK